MTAQAAAVEVKKGEIVSGMRSISDPSQTYALYLPSSYDPARTHPALLVFDPRGRSALAAEIFRPAAERFGWILISSDQTRSDGPAAPNYKAVDALWKEVRGRYPTDARRLYAAGFSGGGILTLVLGLSVPGGLAGVIDVGGRLPPELPLEKATFAHYGAVGRFDFNFVEMRAIDQDYQGLGPAHRLDVFDGAHQWLPGELALRAVTWHEVLAMKAGTRPRDPAVVDELYQQDLGAGAALLERPLEALRHFEMMERTFGGLRGVDEVRTALLARRADRRLAEAERAEQRGEGLERRATAATAQAIAHIRSDEPLTRGQLRGILRLDELGHKASGRGEEAEAAQRALESIFSQVSFYLVQELFQRQDMRRAALVLEVAAELKPQAPAVQYNLACAYARLGDKTRALDALERALRAGFSDADRLRTDPDLGRLRADPRFQALLGRL